MKNTENSFGFVTRILHWTMSPLIICLLCVGFYMTGMENSPDKFELYGLHKAFGVVALALASIRILWRLSNITPNLPSAMPKMQVLLYKAGVFSMYCLMFAMPISGLLMSLYSGRDISVFGLFTIHGFEKNEQISSLAHDAHGLFPYAFIAFITAHSMVALYHHFVMKDRLLMRMVKGQ